MDSFQTEPLNLTRIESVTSEKSARDLCKDCNSEYCIVKKFQQYQSERIAVNTYQRYGCVLCSKTYSALSTLRNHQRTHFSCEFCAKWFYVEYELKVHLQQHHTEENLEKPFECGVCAKRFSRQSSLSAHNRIHKNSEVHFECSTCGKQFRWKSNLSAHLALYESQRYACELCTKIYETLDQLQVHKKNMQKINAAFVKKPFQHDTN